MLKKLLGNSVRETRNYVVLFQPVVGTPFSPKLLSPLGDKKHGFCAPASTIGSLGKGLPCTKEVL